MNVNVKKLYIILTISLFVFPAFLTEAANYEYLNSVAGRGDTIVIYFKNNKSAIKSAAFGTQPISYFKYKKDYVAVFATSATQAVGKYSVKINFSDGTVFKKILAIKVLSTPKKIALGIPKKLDMTPASLVSNLRTQNAVLNNVFSATSTEIFFNSPFGLPLANNRNLGSLYGEIRQTGNEQIRHMGVDLIAPLGASVYAMNYGIISKVYYDPVYGNSILINHGHGIFTAYFHLNTTIIKQGDKVQKGAKIGTVGKTGYATGPHLHLSVKINGISVNPLKFISAFK